MPDLFSSVEFDEWVSDLDRDVVTDDALRAALGLDWKQDELSGGPRALRACEGGDVRAIGEDFVLYGDL